MSPLALRWLPGGAGLQLRLAERYDSFAVAAELPLECLCANDRVVADHARELGRIGVELARKLALRIKGADVSSAVNAPADGDRERRCRELALDAPPDDDHAGRGHRPLERGAFLDDRRLT